MFYNNDRNAMRRHFREVWRKAQQRLPLEPMDRVIADVIGMHPEYHTMLTTDNTALDQDFLPEMGQTNPFLHMGMHIALMEQLATNRPAGISAIYQTLLIKSGDAHSAHHGMLDCLAEMLMLMQKQQQPPDEALYLRCLRQAAGLPVD